MAEPCGICAIQAAQEAGDDPWAVARLATGSVGLSPDQYYEGFTFFSCRWCVVELDDLPAADRAAFLHEMAEVAAAVRRAFRPRKMNLAALGNLEPHLHWHLIPRHDDDPLPHEPIWSNPARKGPAAAVPVPDDRRRELVARLVAELRRADVTIERLLTPD